MAHQEFHFAILAHDSNYHAVRLKDFPFSI